MRRFPLQVEFDAYQKEDLVAYPSIKAWMAIWQLLMISEKARESGEKASQGVLNVPVESATRRLKYQFEGCTSSPLAVS